jgi:hypothetical protein
MAVGNETVAASKERRYNNGKRHYQTVLLNTGELLLKNDGEFQEKKYALFKRRLFQTTFIDSFGGGIR